MDKTMENTVLISSESSEEEHDSEDLSALWKYTNWNFEGSQKETAIIFSPIKFSSKVKMQGKARVKCKMSSGKESKGRKEKIIKKGARIDKNKTKKASKGILHEDRLQKETGSTAASDSRPAKNDQRIVTLSRLKSSSLLPKSNLKIINDTYVPLINVKSKCASGKMNTFLVNSLHGYEDHVFRLAYLNTLLSMSTDRRLPPPGVVLHTMNMLRKSTRLPVSFKARDCLQRLTVLGLINYQNFSMKFDEIFELVQDVCSKKFEEDKLLWVNTYWLLEAVLAMFEHDNQRYQNNLRSSLVRKCFIPATGRYDHFCRLFQNLKMIMSEWSNQDVFVLCSENMTVSLTFKQVLLTVQKVVITYVSACEFTPSVAHEYQSCYESLRSSDQKVFFLSTIPDVKLKCLLLDTILEGLQSTVVDYDLALTLTKIVYVHYERLPPRHPDTCLPEDQATLFSSEEVDEFVLLNCLLTELYIQSYQCSCQTFSEDEVQILGEMESIVNRLTKSLEGIVANGQILLVTKLKLRSLSQVGNLVKFR